MADPVNNPEARKLRLDLSSYTSPSERHGCWKCRSLATSKAKRAKTLRCTLHKIYVHKLGVCPCFVEDPSR